MSASYGVFTPSSVADAMNQAPPNGNQIAYINSGHIFQALTGNVLQQGTYTLTVYVGNRNDETFGGADVYLLAGGTADDSSGSVAAPTKGTYSLVTVTDVVAASDPLLGQTLGIELQNTSNGGQTDFDLVGLTFTAAVTATPLPATLSLFAGGLGFVGFLAKRRKQNAKQAIAAA